MAQNEVYDIYSISFNGRIIYIGMTSVGSHRWVCHKTKARQCNLHSRPLHDFMRENTSDLTTFPEFTYDVICKCYDEDTAKMLEKYFQDLHDIPSRHYCPMSNPYLTDPF
jgi:hypothetical protein